MADKSLSAKSVSPREQKALHLTPELVQIRQLLRSHSSALSQNLIDYQTLLNWGFLIRRSLSNPIARKQLHYPVARLRQYLPVRGQLSSSQV
ncbi:hypothetical protein [Nostoc sp. TCL240-02]|uniref:hypothetical protein n=1 Tax=Nostoc sp. TCL240-02 TaxID=2572090 RepID=UPI00157FB53F|nr:hypothetical protein [Nostoc sp. TCL240-02]